MSARIPKRKAHTSAKYGAVSVQTLGSIPDQPEHRRTVAETDDIGLAQALAMRGYDVRLRQPPPETIAKRQRKRIRAAIREAKTGGAR